MVVFIAYAVLDRAKLFGLFPDSLKNIQFITIFFITLNLS